MTARLVHLLRHGATPLTGRLVGRTDCEVTQAGIAACRDRVKGLAFDAIVSSDLIRALDCAGSIGSPLNIDRRWRELDFGAWDGFATAEINPDALGAFWADPEAFPPPEGERWSSLVARVGGALAELPEGNVLVVTHAGAMRAALAYLFGFGPTELWAFDLPCASLLTLRLWPDGAQIVGLAS
jgi:alpha-ribazole phosphatase